MKKENRIKKNSEIALIVLSKQKIKSDSFFIYYKKSELKTRVAISVSKKYGNAVSRNHAKRIIRELIRPYIAKSIPLDLVIVVKKDLKLVSFEKLVEEMKTSLVRIEKRINN